MHLADEFATTDVDLAAFLQVRGFTVLRVDPPAQRPWLADFIFADSLSLMRSVALWGEDDADLQVDAKEFAKQRVRLYRWARSALDAIRPEHVRGRRA